MLSAYCVPHGVEYIDEVARRAHLAEQSYSREHFHLLVRDAVDAPELFVLAEVFPRRDSRGRCFAPEHEDWRGRKVRDDRVRALQRAASKSCRTDDACPIRDARHTGLKS